jgi:hypothetical protein
MQALKTPDVCMKRGDFFQAKNKSAIIFFEFLEVLA